MKDTNYMKDFGFISGNEEVIDALSYINKRTKATEPSQYELQQKGKMVCFSTLSPPTKDYYVLAVTLYKDGIRDSKTISTIDFGYLCRIIENRLQIAKGNAIEESIPDVENCMMRYPFCFESLFKDNLGKNLYGISGEYRRKYNCHSIYVVPKDFIYDTLNTILDDDLFVTAKRVGITKIVVYVENHRYPVPKRFMELNKNE